MGKRSDYERVERDFYPTPEAAVLPLLSYLPTHTTFVEPCAGDGQLIDILEKYGHECVYASDIEPQREGIIQSDFADVTRDKMGVYAYKIITNPPWNRKILHPMIEHFLEQKLGFWFLFDADWMHTKQAMEYLPYVHKIVSIGRVKWIPDSKSSGKDNCCWYYFSHIKPYLNKTLFYGRT